MNGRRPRDRVLLRLEELFAINVGEGANRLGLTAAEERACVLVASWMEDAGLSVERDAAGNVVGRLLGRRPDLREVWTGSHLDTVPNGGRFDGALGVTAGIEAADELARGDRPEHTVAVVAFRDEEGVRFGGGCFGSRALCGRLDPGELGKTDSDGITLGESLATLGIDPPPRAGWLDGRIGFFVEMHVEQGSRLADAGVPLGVVTGIAGTSGTRVTFHGRADHAGTTPMTSRADALVAAADLVQAVGPIARGFDGAVATVGQIAVAPGAANVVPAEARLTVDARAPDVERLDALIAAVEAEAQGAAERSRCTVQTARLWYYDPVAMDERPRTVLRSAIEGLRTPYLELASGAGHDAAVLAQAGVPAGMLFVRSLAGGVSHRPDEWSDEADVELAVQVLADTLRALATA